MTSGRGAAVLPDGEECVWLPTAAEMAALDQQATSSGATTERVLIESAGREIAHAVQDRFPEGRVVGLIGSGHNGADALVALRTLGAWGREIEAVQCGSKPPEPNVLVGWPIELQSQDAAPALCEAAGVVLDGLLGTGSRGAPREPMAGIIERVNASTRAVVAVDGPSGVDFTSGAVAGSAIRASLTVSLGWPKLGLLRFPARGYCGDLLAVEIGFPPPPAPFGARAITSRWVAALLPRRPANAHKGDAGYVAIVAGQAGMAGASVLAARAAARGGAGIVRVIGDPANRTIVQSAAPDVIFVGWDDAEEVDASVGWADAIVIGPGLGHGPGRRELVERVLTDAKMADKPTLVDADGINVWQGEVDELKGRLPERALLTPHPGELGRLLGVTLAEVVADPPAIASDAATRLGRTVLLKGNPSVVAEPGAPLRVSTTGDLALATGGAGDVLSGCCGAYLAAGASPADAAAVALHISGVAGLVAEVPVGHVASDLPDRLPGARAVVEESASSSLEARFSLPAARGV